MFESFDKIMPFNLKEIPELECRPKSSRPRPRLERAEAEMRHETFEPNLYKMSRVFLTLNFAHFDEFPNTLQYTRL